MVETGEAGDLVTGIANANARHLRAFVPPDGISPATMATLRRVIAEEAEAIEREAAQLCTALRTGVYDDR